MPETTLTHARTDSAKLQRQDIDQAILDIVVQSSAPVKARQIVDRLAQGIPFHEVVSSIWRLADVGKLQVHASRGVTIGK